MKIPHDDFCVLPWISLETSPIGSLRPCCLAEDEITDSTGQKFELQSADLSNVLDGKYMTSLREEFLNKLKPPTCRKCWNEEASGRTSKRMHTLDRLKHVIPDTEWTNKSKGLQFLDLKLGNICNLKCRICGSWSSSQFAAEELKFTNKAERKGSFHHTMLQKGAWPRKSQTFWEQMDTVVDDIKYIEFTGGEPFMIQEHFDLLQSIVDKGIAHQVEIHYNTNGTQYPKQGPNIWKHFKTVEIAFSIDDLNERFEYQRTNAVWKEVQHNISRYVQLKDFLPNLQLQVCSTVNVFNVFYLEGLANWIDQQGFDFVYWNMMHEAYYFSISTLPKYAKAQAEQRLRAAQVTPKHQKEFNNIIEFMHAGESLDGSVLREQVGLLDHRRKQNLALHHDELAKAIDYAGP